MDNEQVYYTIILRHDTSTQWAVNNPILMAGEYGVEDDTHRVKRGDGKTAWNELTYEHFGLEYIVTFGNLLGDIDDNAKLKAEFDDRLTKSTFQNSNNMLVTNITITDVEGEIGKITKTQKNVISGSNSDTYLYIRSNDHSIQGSYSIDANGAKILNLTAESAIEDYEPNKNYYEDQLCFYKDKLYRAKDNFQAPLTFDETQWIIMASQIAKDIKYDNKISGLEATNVKEAIDELQDLDSNKVKQTARENKIYGTNEYGEQHLYDKDSLRTVDTVNGVRASANKNIQIDADDINYDDDVENTESIKKVLDSKVDKIVAGKGSKIVKDIVLSYNDENGMLTLKKDKVSLEDGNTDIETTEIEVTSDKELQALKEEIESEIDTAKTDLTAKINNEVNTLNTRIDNEINTLNTTINDKETTINATIEANKLDIENKLNNTKNILQDQINTNKENIATNTQTIENNKLDIENKLEQTETELNTKIDTNNTNINNRVTNEVQALTELINAKEVSLNTTIEANKADIENKLTNTNTTINERIDSEVDTLNNKINSNKTDIETKLTEGLDLKIDKNISDNIVVGIEVATRTNEPTLKITSKNTSSKNEVLDYVHFSPNGNIKTYMRDADHLVIDSSDIDDNIASNSIRLDGIDSNIEGITKDIQSLKTKDTQHEKTLATHTSQIADHENRIYDLESRADGFDTEITNIKNTNATQETHLTSIDQTLVDHQNQIRTNAEAIVATNENVSENLNKIEDLYNTKTDKNFANLTNNRVIGSLKTAKIENNEIFGLTGKTISPVDKTTVDFNIKVISSDNTIVATQKEDGTIDLATNLDTDVNYFITSQILNTTIPSENTIPLNTLTSTDKPNLEVHDIISDPEGTWARVNSIDTEKGTCIAITFKKHAQAVWGTVKGNIEDQQDLQEQFNNLESNLTNYIDEADNTLTARINTTDENLSNEVNNRVNADTALDNAKVDKVNEANQIYGTDEEGNQTSYNKNSFGKVDTVNNLTPDSNKNVKVTGEEIQLFNDQSIEENGYTSANIRQAIENIYSSIFNLAVSIRDRITSYIPGNYYASHFEVYFPEIFSNSISNVGSVDAYVTFERNDGVILMAKVMNDFNADNTQSTAYESFMVDVEAGNLKLVGIPEQIGEEVEPEPGPGPEPNWNQVQEISITSVTSSDGVNPRVCIYEDLNQTGPTCGINIFNDSNVDKLKSNGVIETELDPTNSTGIIVHYDFYPSDLQTEQDILSIISFEFITPTAFETTHVNIHLLDDNSNPVNIADTIQNVSLTNTDTLEEYYPITGLDNAIIFDDIPTNANYEFNGTCPGYIIPANGFTNTIFINNESNDQNFNIIIQLETSPEQEYIDTMNILNNVDGNVESYEGLGGTEEEVGAVLDEVLGEVTPTPSINIEVGHTYRFTPKENPTISADNLDNIYGIKYIASDEYPRYEYDISIHNTLDDYYHYQVDYFKTYVDEEQLEYGDFQYLYNINTLKWMDRMTEEETTFNSFTFTVTSLYQDREWTTDAINMLLGYFDIEDITE